MFFTDYILKYIVDQTNLYQQQCATKHDFTHLEWYLLTIPELKTWLGLLLSMGMLQKIWSSFRLLVSRACPSHPHFWSHNAIKEVFTNHEVLAFCK